MRGSSLSSSKSALMSAIAASCCTEESFESSSKKPITDETADDMASDIVVAGLTTQGSSIGKWSYFAKKGAADCGCSPPSRHYEALKYLHIRTPRLA
jgi:hypothetical protein